MAVAPASGPAPGGESREQPAPDTAHRPYSLSGTLLECLEGTEQLAARIEDCAFRLAAYLRETANWSGSWKVGDNNHFQVTTTLEDGLEIVQTFSSEPDEDVHWRVVARNAGADVAIVDRARRDHLTRYGFAPGPEFMRWERDFRIASNREAALAARDVLSLLAEGFGWSGGAPLTFTLAREQRARTGLLYQSLTPEDLRRLLHGWGYRAELGTTVSGNPVVRSGAGGYKFHILFAWPAKDGRSYGCLNFVTVFTARHGLTLSVLNDISRSSRFSRLYLDDEGDLILERDVSLSGGVATEYVQECLLDWTCMMESVFKKVDKLTAPSVVMH
ncbi:MAG: YbjN domain-containing protein [Rhodospirillaceae bacterium]